MNTVISTFAGCGGSSLGYHMAGFKELLAIDWDKNSEETFKENFPSVPFWNRNIKEVSAEEILQFCNLKPGELDVFDGSPPCTTFSVASMGFHWTYDDGKSVPKTEECLKGIAILRKTISIIATLKPQYWFLENPRGMMRTVIDKIFEEEGIKDYERHTVAYCQYGDKRRKATDIWTNCKAWKSRPMCNNGDSCHEAAPRGAKTGTQGLDGDVERGRIPEELCLEVINACEQ